MDRVRTAVVTGATSGLGRYAAETIARTPGWAVALAVRDVDRGKAIAQEIGGRERPPDVVRLDLASLASVRAAAAELTERARPLDALVLNAGVQVPRADQVTADGFELTFGVNHLGHFLLAQLLHDTLAASNGDRNARIAVVSSGTHWGTLAKSGPFPKPRWRDPKELARADGGSGQVAYATSKLANLYFTYEAARRWAAAEPGGIAVNAFDPGLMPATGLARHYPARAQAFSRLLTPLVERLPFAARPPESGAQLARLVTDPAWEGVTGRYVERDRLAESSPESQDRARAARLWEASEELVGLAGAVPDR